MDAAEKARDVLGPIIMPMIDGVERILAETERFEAALPAVAEKHRWILRGSVDVRRALLQLHLGNLQGVCDRIVKLAADPLPTWCLEDSVARLPSPQW